MNKQPVKLDPSALSFTERVRQRLQKIYAGEISADSCLLLDNSGSMFDGLDGSIYHLGVCGKRKIDALRDLASKFTSVRRFIFNYSCWEIAAADIIPEPNGGTSMHAAFLALKAAGISHVVMITDGLPDDSRLALETAAGLRIDVFYVGPDPAPDILRLLAERSGGEYGRATFADGGKALESKIRGLLSAPK